MYGLYWEPPAELAYAGPALALPAALPRFLGLSAAAHCLAVLVFLWVGLPVNLTARPDAVAIREIDFIDAGGGGGSTASVAPAPHRTPFATPRGIQAPKRVGAEAPRIVGRPASADAIPGEPTIAAPRPADDPAQGVEAGAGPVPPVIIAGQDGRSGNGRGTGSGAGAGSGEGPGVGAGRGLGIDAANPDFTRYFTLIKDRVYAAWRYPPGVTGTHRLSLRFTLERDGAARAVRVLNSSNAALDASALAAMERASPFPPIPDTLRQLAGEPLTMIFTVTVR
jgi:TonB family protein